MAIPKKGSRKIIVEGIQYRWLIRHKPTYFQGSCESPLTVVVELFEQPSSILVLDFSLPRPDNWMKQEGLTVTPWQIECSIKQGLQNGWNPEQPGPPQHLTI